MLDKKSIKHFIYTQITWEKLNFRTQNISKAAWANSGTKLQTFKKLTELSQRIHVHVSKTFHMHSMFLTELLSCCYNVPKELGSFGTVSKASKARELHVMHS